MFKEETTSSFLNSLFYPFSQRTAVDNLFMPLIELLHWARGLITAHGWLSIQKQRHAPRGFSQTIRLSFPPLNCFFYGWICNLLVFIRFMKLPEACGSSKHLWLLGFSCWRINPISMLVKRQMRKMQPV